ncbi:MAG: hypothetical protein GX817_05470 [Elusimicrobia bacterium]|nr:hypothetical protein [Elusimicrobiota bacterium]
MKNILEKYNYPEDEIAPLIDRYRRGEFQPSDNVLKAKVEAPADDAFGSLPPEGSPERARLYSIGMEAIEKGQLALVILNGGMATRFGGLVKGIVEVFDGMSFLELKIRTAMRISDKISFYIMNSFSTEEGTKKHFEEKNYFGIPERIKMFNQFIAPRINEKGEFFRQGDPTKGYYGPGHGDFPYAFKESGELKNFEDAGGKYIFFSNVDNLGALPIPEILGYHIESGAELTAEEAEKAPGDEGGAPALVDGRLQLVEGFAFPEGFDTSKIPVFNCNSYWVNSEALRKNFDLPWYIVEKEADSEKVIQFEHIAGDLTIFLESAFLRVSRDERFFPVKRPEDLENSREALRKLTGY